MARPFDAALSEMINDYIAPKCWCSIAEPVGIFVDGRQITLGGNMNEQLFAVAVVYRPNEEERKAGKVAAIVVEPHWVLAKGEGVAKMGAIRQIPEGMALENVEVFVRPF